MSFFNFNYITFRLPPSDSDKQDIIVAAVKQLRRKREVEEEAEKQEEEKRGEEHTAKQVEISSEVLGIRHVL